MRYAEPVYGEEPIAIGIFSAGDTVTIKILDMETDALIPLTASGCTESAVVSGFFTFPTSGIVTPLSGFRQVYYVMENAAGRQHPGKLVIGGYPSDSAVNRFGGQIHIDVANGGGGTDFPLGTPEDPVSGLSDGRNIADRENIPAYHIEGALALTSGHIDWSFTGVEPADDYVDVASGAAVSGCQFSTIGIRGTLDGRITAQDCLLGAPGGTVSGIQGLFQSCGVQGTLRVAANATFQALTIASQSLIPGTIFDMAEGGAAQAVLMGDAVGIFQLSNMGTGFAGITLAGGQLTLNASCTGGIIFLFGHGRLVDNSAGSTVFNYMVEPGELDTLQSTLDVVSGDLATHDAALTAHDTVLDAVSADVAALDFSSLETTVDVVSADLAAHDAALTAHDTVLDAVSADVAALDFSSLETTVDVVSADLAAHDAALTAHDTVLDAVSADVAALDFSSLETTVDVVSADLAAHNAALTAHDAVLDAVSADLVAHNATLDVVSADIQGISGMDLSTLQATVDAVSADLLAHDGALTAHDTVLDAVSADVAALDFSSLETTVDVVSADLAAHDAALTAHDGTLDVVSADVANIPTTDLSGIEATLDAVSADLVTHDGNLSTHDTALTAVAAAVANVDADLVSHDAALTAHDSKLDTVEGKVDNLDADLVTHNAALAAHAADLDAVSADLVTHSAALTTHATDLDVVSGNLDVVAGDVERLYGRNTRTRLHYTNADIVSGLAGATRSVPSGNASHLETQVKTDLAAGWGGATTYYVVFNYSTAASGTTPPAAAEPATAAPSDGTFFTEPYP